MSNEKVVTLYSLALPLVGIQSCRLRAAYFHVKVVSAFPYTPWLCKALTERQGWSPSHIIWSQSKTKQNIQPSPCPPLRRLRMFDLLSHILPQQSPRIFFPLLVTMILNKKIFTFEFETLR